MDARSKLTDVAPKDVKQLEVLKPINTPSMGERFKQAIEKEKRLEAASRPTQKAKQGEATEAKATKKSKKSKKKKNKGPAPVQNPGGLEQEDEVEEGINWSDDEE